MMKTVFDVGMFGGSDTKYYAAVGFRVIAVEANPTLAERARKRLADGSRSSSYKWAEEPGQVKPMQPGFVCRGIQAWFKCACGLCENKKRAFEIGPHGASYR